MQGSELREMRNALGLSQLQMAEAIGMSRVQVNQMENGARPIEKRTELAVRYLALTQGTD